MPTYNCITFNIIIILITLIILQNHTRKNIAFKVVMLHLSIIIDLFNFFTIDLQYDIDLQYTCNYQVL